MILIKKSLFILIIVFCVYPAFVYAEITAQNFMGDYNIIKDTVLEGELYIKGIVNIASGITVTIKPGTVIKFFKLDSDGDDIGESGIYVQGVLSARGDRDKPIIFTSAESSPGRGDWDNIFFIASESEENVLENCNISYAFHGIHSHFAMLKIKNVSLENNYRGMQFQESIINIEDCIFKKNNSAIRFRDSNVLISNNIFSDNYIALSFLRSEVIIKGNTIEGSILQSIHSRESKGSIEKNKIFHNCQGIYLKESGMTLKGNFLSENNENGISLNFCSDTVVVENNIEWNGGHGIAVDDSSFELKNNNIFFNGKYNLYLQTGKDIYAENNWWGKADESYIKSKIYDFAYDSTIGKAIYKPFLENPFDSLKAEQPLNQ